MASKKKNKPRKSFPAASSTVPTVEEKKTPAKKGNPGQPFRETVESLVIAFVLAFLFRTFQAEAFVIPTGSMAPTLMGGHKDVYCPECEQRFKINASNENAENISADQVEQLRRGLAGAARQAPNRAFADYLMGIARGPASGVLAELETVGGVCPSCRYTMPLDDKLPKAAVPPGATPEDDPTYSGDRILVNKYVYSFSEPQRWDVIVFKYPGNAVRNYIKRLVGLPSEELMLAGGDVYTRPAGEGGEYQITRKPPHKIMAMRQLVHDTDRDAAALYKAGWPLRWQRDGWEVEAGAEGLVVEQKYSADAGDQPAWLRYEHTPADHATWIAALEGKKLGAARPELVTDFNAYNTEIERRQLTLAPPPPALAPEATQFGLHWVGDLMVEADVEVAEGAGELMLELVEAGRRYRCTIDLATGEATLAAFEFGSDEPVEGFGPRAKTGVRSGGHRLRFSNFDNQLVLWVGDEVIAFDAPTATPPTERIGVPQTSGGDPGDLAPVRVGARGAKLSVNRLQVFRDLYYIAISADEPQTLNGPGNVLTDIPQNGNLGINVDGVRGTVPEVRRNPELWPVLADRFEVEFSTAADQFFVMGDNSAASADCRIWTRSGMDGGKPGGPYLERDQLIGKAVCVYWPHSWYPIPFTNRKIPLVPNFADMRLVR